MWRLNAITNETNAEIIVNYPLAAAANFSDRLPTGNLSIVMPNIGILYCEDIGVIEEKSSNPDSNRILGVIISLNEKRWIIKYIDDIESLGMATFDLTLTADGSIYIATIFMGFVGFEEQTSLIQEEINQLKSDYQLPKLQINASDAEIAAQSKLDGGISFIHALSKAINSFIYDGADIDSPFGLIRNDPGSFDLTYPADEDDISEKIQFYLNMDNASITLLVLDPDAIDRRQFMPERGEQISDNWIFRLESQMSSDLHWAIIDRQGLRPTINYGFS